MLWFLTSCLTERTCRSRRSIVFGTYHGALVIILSILDWKPSRVSMLEFDAVPHSCIPYVHTGFRMVLYKISKELTDWFFLVGWLVGLVVR